MLSTARGLRFWCTLIDAPAGRVGGRAGHRCREHLAMVRADSITGIRRFQLTSPYASLAGYRRTFAEDARHENSNMSTDTPARTR
jgi:hypothetical protein